MMVSRSVGIMPNPLDTREIFYSNLLLLNFDPVAMESREKIPFSRDMFALPNKKGMEIVMYFLFSKLNPQMTFEEFRECWPVKNKVDEQKFRKTCYNWVSRLAKEESDTYFPRIVQSLFHSPGGDKFYNFLLLFSMYVLKIVMLRDHSRHVSIPTFPSKSIHNQAFTQVISKSLQVHTSLHRKRFLELTKYSLDVQQHWKNYAIELNKENRSLKKKKKDLDKKLQKETSYRGEQMAKSIAASSDYQREVDALQRTQQLQKVRSLWQGVEDFYLEHKPEVIDSVLTNQANQHRLDATDVDVKIPDLLLREFERDIHMRKVGNTYIGGKLNLLSLVQLWNLSLNLIKDKIQQESLPGFDESSTKLKNDIHSHHSLLTNAEYLRSSLTKETLPELKESVEQLKAIIHKNIYEIQGMLKPQCPTAFNLGIGLIPATPPVSFIAAETPASQRITSFQESLKRTPALVSTPDVVSAWSESLVGRRPPVQSHKTRPYKPNRQDKDKKQPTMEAPTQIPKPKTFSTGITRNYYKMGRDHKPLTKKGLASSAKKQVTTKSRTNDIISPLAVEHTRKGIKTEPRRGSTKERLEEKGKRAATDDVANQIIGALSADQPDSGSSSQSSRSSTPKPQAIDDPLEALDETAFVSHDLLSRTPAPKRSHESPSKTIHTEEKDTARRSLLNDSGGLLETILDHVTENTPRKTVRTSLFSSPDDNGEPHHDNSLTEDNRPSSRQDLLPPFAFTTTGVFDEESNKEKRTDAFKLLTPFSFTTPLSATNSSAKGTVKNDFSPLTSKPGDNDVTPNIGKLIQFTPIAEKTTQSAEKHIDEVASHDFRGEFISTERPSEFTPVSKLLGSTFTTFTQTDRVSSQKITTTETPKAERPMTFTPAAEKMSSPAAKETRAERLIGLTPTAQQTPDLTITTSDDLQSPFMLSKLFEDQLSLSNKKLAMGSPVSLVTHGDSKHDHNHNEAVTTCMPSTTLADGGRSHISVFAPTVANDSKQWSRMDADGQTYQSKRSPFGALHVSDDEEVSTSLSSAKPNVSDITASFKGMQESDLMSRLNRIKAAQRDDYKYISPSQDTVGAEPGNDLYNIAMETIQAKRLDQIKEAQQGQQVTPGSNTQNNFENHRGAEGALLTPLTASSAGSPQNGTTDHVPKFSYDSNIKPATSNLSTPTSMLSERYLAESPHGKGKDEIVFSLDSPVLPSSATNGLSSPEEEVITKRSPDIVGSGLGVDLGAGSSDHSFDSGQSPIPSLLRSGGKTAWLPSSGATPDQDITKLEDRRYSYDNFLNESFDTSFLVRATPRHEPSRGSHALRTPIQNHEAVATVTSNQRNVSPAIGDLIDF